MCDSFSYDKTYQQINDIMSDTKQYIIIYNNMFVVVERCSRNNRSKMYFNFDLPYDFYDVGYFQY